MPSYAVGDDLRSGRLVPLLADCEGSRLAVYAVYQHRNYLAAKTRVFVDFLAESFGPDPSWDRDA